MYGKIFESMYDGTLSADWKAMVTFQQLIVLADSEGIIDYTPDALSRRTGIPLDIIEHGIATLQEPDKYSKSSDYGGKRIALLDDQRPWGWSIVNYAQYRDMATREDQRAGARERKRKQRERQAQAVENNDPSQDVTDGHNQSRHEDEDANADADAKEPTAQGSADRFDLEAFKSIYPKRAGGQPWKRASRAISARQSEGHSIVEIMEGVERYAAFVKAKGSEGSEFVLQAATFCGPEKHFLESWKPPPTKSEARQGKNIDAANRWLDG